jgi:hypothetical protein
MKRYIALFVLLVAVLGLAHAIEITARPETHREGHIVAGETQGGGMGESGGGEHEH